MLRKIACIVFGLAGLLLAAWLLQPLKKGKGLDTATKYERVRDWPRLPAGFNMGSPTGIGTNKDGNAVVFCRAGREWPFFGSMPDTPISNKTVLIINKDSGTLIDAWGAGLFVMPHGLTVDAGNNIWLTDVGLHQVFKFSHGGKLLLKLGEAKVAGADSSHFNRPTGVAVAKDGSFYVSDGYGNSRVIKFSAGGRYLFEWGRKGEGEGEFNVPHGICLDGKGNVYVADRENNRIQVFDSGGKFLKQFRDKTFGALCGVAFNKPGTKLMAVDDLSFLRLRHRGSDLLIFDSLGRVQTRFGRSGSYEGPAAWYHAVAVDNDENIYAGDISGNTLQKFTRVSNR